MQHYLDELAQQIEVQLEVQQTEALLEVQPEVPQIEVQQIEVQQIEAQQIEEVSLLVCLENWLSTNKTPL